MRQVEGVRYPQRAEEAVDQLLLRQLDILVGVRKEEGIQQHHDRKEDALRNFKGLDDGVERLLPRLAVKLHPSGVALRERVGLVGPEIPSGAEGAIDVDHHQGQARAGGPMQHLVHQGQAVRRSGGESSRADGGGGDAAGHGGVLRFHLDEARLELAGGDHVGKLFHHRSLRGDGIGGYHLGSRHAHGMRDRRVAFQHGPHRLASCMAIAPRGHSSTHIPQPLQCPESISSSPAELP